MDDRFRREEGSALIELSLILPVLLLMLLGVLDYGLVFQQYMTLNDSVRATAYYATMYGDAADTGTMVTLATQFAATVPNYNATATVVCSCTPGGAIVDCTSAYCSGTIAAPRQYTQITATATLPLLFRITGLPVGIPVTSTTMVPISFRGGI